jgi:signal transduction histidine kinase
VTKDVSHVKRFREKLGIQGLLRQLKALPGIVYVVLFDQTGEMARETDPLLPQPVEDPPDVGKGPQILHLVTPTGARYTVLDIAIPLNSEHLQKGVLRLGLDGRGLGLARSKFLKSLIVRSALFLLVALLLLYYLLIYNNYQLLAREHQVIKKDVQRLEEEKQVSERLTAMGQLASGVAHEIRNPLNSIRMISQRLRMEFEPRSDGEEYERLTRVIQSESDRINRIVSDFLRFARPQPLRKEMLDPGGCLRETLELLQPRLEAVGCKLVVSVPQLPALPVDCDRLKQVFLNLLENALEAVGAEGRIEVSAEKKERFLVFRIRDNGRGIAAEDLPKIFNLYFTTRAEGSGIGLAVVHQIISDHGGSVQVESQPGEGTTFIIYLPLKQRMTGRA